ncbi:MAG TPA: CBS domain-containing protein [Tissierellaceae bacterium]|nr:CBS domain-containing protein [Tissierellaceae bacterium]
MYIRSHMLPKEKLTTVQLDDNLKSVLEKIDSDNFLSLPVFDKEKFKGIIMKETIYRTYFENSENDKESYLNNTKVKEIYNEEYKSISGDEGIEKASYLLKELGTPFLPVFDDQNRFMGILTHHAIFKAFTEAFGLDKGTRIVVNMFNLPGQIARLTEVIRKEDINIMNLTTVDPEVLDLMQVIIRIDIGSKKLDRLIEKMQLAGFKIGEISSK